MVDKRRITTVNYIRKIISLSFALCVLLLLPINNADASFQVIHETKSSTALTSGVIYEKISRFTQEGWLYINVLKVDLENPNVKINTISNKESITKLVNLKDLAKSNGAIAAINASFFNWQTPGGFPDGPVVESSQVTTAFSDYNRYNDSMVTFALDDTNNALYSFWKPQITFQSQDKSISVRQYNRPSPNNYTDVTILDRIWGKNSIGVSTDRPDIVEIVISRGIIKEIRKAMPAIEIPEDGFVVVARGVDGEFLEKNFTEGQLANYSITTNPDWRKIQMAVTGSTILVRDGEIPSTFSHNIAGRRPRTAVGSSKEGKILYLVTVDGRITQTEISKSLGMTQTEIGEFMLSIGAYNALNLDGGGSTTMVLKNSTDNSIQLANSPSEGSLRSIANGIGIFSMLPPSDLAGFNITCLDTRVFVNTPREFKAYPYDTYLNPYKANQSKIQWSVSGVKGSFTDNVFIPEEAGNATITATLDGISSSIEIECLEAPSQLILTNENIQLTKGSSKTIYVRGKDKNGYSAPISNNSINWSIDGDIGIVDKGTFTANKSGTGAIQASFGNVASYCTVSVATENSIVKETFEKLNGAFLSAPSDTPGSYGISNEQKKSGSFSGKLTYDFTNTEGTRAAYFVPSDAGINLDTNTVKVGLWVHNNTENSNWLRLEITDKDNKKHLFDLAKNIDWTGWKKVETNIGSISLPAKISRIYLAQINPISLSGSIYLDDLEFTNSSYPSIGQNKVPQDKIIPDFANKETKFADNPESLRFSVIRLKGEPQNLLERLLLNKFSSKANQFKDVCVTLGETSKTSNEIITSQNIITNNSYKSYTIKNNLLIQLDTSKESIRLSNSGQWQWFFNQLKGYTGNNIFVFLKQSPDSFTDPSEGNLFKQVLKEYKCSQDKNIWVLYGGSKNQSFMEDGVRYVETKGFYENNLNPSNAKNLKYFEITVNNNDISYEIKNLLD